MVRRVKVQQVPVSIKGVLARANRKLQPQGRQLCTAKGATKIAALGLYYLRDGSGVLRTHLDLESYAREIGILAAYEALA